MYFWSEFYRDQEEEFIKVMEERWGG